MVSFEEKFGAVPHPPSAARVVRETFEEKEEAEKREKFLKSGRGREELKKIIDGAVPKW